MPLPIPTDVTLNGAKGLAIDCRPNAMVSFIGLPSMLHHLEWKIDMTNSAWSGCVSNMAFCAGTMLSTNPVDSSVTRRFYRVNATC